MNEIKSITQNATNTIKQNLTNIKNEFSTGFNLDTEKAEQDVSDLTQKLNQAQKELNKLSNAKRPNTQAIAKMTSIVKNLELNLKSAKADLDMLNNSNMANLGSKVKSLGTNIKKAFSFSNLKNSLTDFGSKVTKTFSKIIKGSNSSGNTLSKMASKASGSLKKMVFALVGVEAGLAGLRRAVQSYLSYDQQLSTQLENTWAGLGSVLAPIIQNIIKLFSTAVAYVNAFVKALFGIDSVANANAKALANQNKQTKSLTSMDEITNINKNDGSGSEQGAIELPKVSMSDFMNQLVEKIKSGDWYGVGQTIAEKVNETLGSIDWSPIQAKASSIGKNIASFFNGGIENTNWTLIGSTMANGLNTAFSFAYSFVITFNWAAWGKSIADSINGFFSTFDWKKAGETLSNGIIGFLEAIKTALSELNWTEIGESIKEFLLSIDWAGIFTELCEAIGELVGGIDELLTALFGEDAATAIEAIAIAIGLVAGAWLLWNAGLVIWNTLISPITLIVLAIAAVVAIIITLVKNWDQVVEAFQTGIQNVKDWFGNLWNGIKETFSNVADWFKNIFSKAWEGIKGVFSSVGSFFKGIWDTIKGIFTTIGTTIGNAIGDAFATVVNTIINFAENTINGFIKAINLAISAINLIPGINIKKLSLLKIPRLDVGTNYVPEDQMAVIHKGEAVVPKKFNSAEYFSNINNNDETNALLVEVNRNLLELIDKDNNLYVDGKNIAQALYRPLKSEEQRLGGSNTVTVR